MIKEEIKVNSKVPFVETSQKKDFVHMDLNVNLRMDLPS
jgi:hypothetical protein